MRLRVWLWWRVCSLFLSKCIVVIRLWLFVVILYFVFWYYFLFLGCKCNIVCLGNEGILCSECIVYIGSVFCEVVCMSLLCVCLYFVLERLIVELLYICWFLFVLIFFFVKILRILKYMFWILILLFLIFLLVFFFLVECSWKFVFWMDLMSVGVFRV